MGGLVLECLKTMADILGKALVPIIRKREDDTALRAAFWGPEQQASLVHEDHSSGLKGSTWETVPTKTQLTMAQRHLHPIQTALAIARSLKYRLKPA